MIDTRFMHAPLAGSGCSLPLVWTREGYYQAYFIGYAYHIPCGAGHVRALLTAPKCLSGKWLIAWLFVMRNIGDAHCMDPGGRQ